MKMNRTPVRPYLAIQETFSYSLEKAEAIVWEQPGHVWKCALAAVVSRPPHHPKLANAREWSEWVGAEMD